MPMQGFPTACRWPARSTAIRPIVELAGNPRAEFQRPSPDNSNGPSVRRRIGTGTLRDSHRSPDVLSAAAPGRRPSARAFPSRTACFRPTRCRWRRRLHARAALLLGDSGEVEPSGHRTARGVDAGHPVGPPDVCVQRPVDELELVQRLDGTGTVTDLDLALDPEGAAGHGTGASRCRRSSPAARRRRRDPSPPPRSGARARARSLSDAARTRGPKSM